MADTNPFRYGQGKLYIGNRDSNGNVATWRWAGDVSAFSVKLSVDKVEHKESYSGQRATVVSFVNGKTATADMTFNQLGIDNLALALYGTSAVTAAGTVTAEAVASTAAVGDTAQLAHPGLTASSLMLKGGSGGTTTLVEDTDYTIDETFGRITFLTAQANPVTADYGYGASTAVAMFTAAAADIGVRYEGINLAAGNAAEIVELYKLSPQPLQELALISSGNDVDGMQVSADVLLDSTKSATGAMGQFGRVTRIGVGS